MAGIVRAMLPAPFFVRGFLVRAVAFWAFVRAVVWSG